MLSGLKQYRLKRDFKKTSEPSGKALGGSRKSKSVGGLFVIEALSVILQVASFKLRGKRIFRMSPLHHHFELTGWKETQVVVRFWIVAFIFALLSLTTLKLR